MGTVKFALDVLLKLLHQTSLAPGLAYVLDWTPCLVAVDGQRAQPAAGRRGGGATGAHAALQVTATQARAKEGGDVAIAGAAGVDRLDHIRFKPEGLAAIAADAATSAAHHDGGLGAVSDRRLGKPLCIRD